jgi:hypothetical protein
LAKVQGDTWGNIFGENVFDVWLNDAAYWSGIPEKVWNYNLGGRRILSKWLSYRGKTMLDRPLAPEEIDHFSQTVRTLARLLLLEAKLNWEWQRHRR